MLSFVPTAMALELRLFKREYESKTTNVGGTPTPALEVVTFMRPLIKQLIERAHDPQQGEPDSPSSSQAVMKLTRPPAPVGGLPPFALLHCE